MISPRTGAEPPLDLPASDRAQVIADNRRMADRSVVIYGKDG